MGIVLERWDPGLSRSRFVGLRQNIAAVDGEGRNSLSIPRRRWGIL